MRSQTSGGGMGAQTPGARARALVFDSGVGGLSVVDALIAAQAPVDLDYLADAAWLPYGGRPEAALLARVPGLIEQAVARLAPDVVVIACNTASTVALEAARARSPVPVIGVVPPIKPAAALSRSGTIGVLATPATIARAYTARLIAQFAAGLTVVRFGSTALVEAAEAKLAGDRVDPAAVEDAIHGLFKQEGGAAIDVVALSCTHFPLLLGELEAAAPRPVTWVESGPAVARRVMETLGLAPGAGPARPERAYLTGAAPASGYLARGFGPPQLWDDFGAVCNSAAAASS